MFLTRLAGIVALCLGRPMSKVDGPGRDRAAEDDVSTKLDRVYLDVYMHIAMGDSQ